MNRLAVHASASSDLVDGRISQCASLVKRIAYHLLGRLPASVQVDDLIQAGMLGLIEASRRYDPTQGASFASFAEPRIRGAMLDEIRRSNWTPRSVHRKARQVSAAIQAVENATGREARAQEVADHLDISLADYHQSLLDLRGQKLLSLDAVGSDDSSEVERLVADGGDPVDAISQESLFQYLATAIDQLPERERLVLSLYYDDELRLKEIGAVLGVTESRVSQLHAQALTRLRARIGRITNAANTPKCNAVADVRNDRPTIQ